MLLISNLFEDVQFTQCQLLKLKVHYMIKVFVVDDDPIFNMIIQKGLAEFDIELSIFTNGQDFLHQLYQNPDIVSLDYNLPDIKGLELLKKIKDFNQDIATLIVSGQEDIKIVVEAYSNGAEQYIIKNHNSLIHIKKAITRISESYELKQELENLREQVIDRNKYSSIIGESKAIIRVIRLIQKIENSNILTLITGESGTGKEVIAKAIHYGSSRKKKPFVAVNLPAIPSDLIESELFGHEKGAFTGASSSRKGKFEEAQGGTIFLDEIGEMEIGFQTKLLRVLQENQISRLGSNKVINLDVRVIAATNKNLGQHVKEGKFREDLYYRIQGFLIHLPTLKQRGNDVLILAKHFLDDYCKQNRLPQKSFDNSVKKVLLDHAWTGNTRELKSVIERCVLICDTDIITTDDLIFSDSVRDDY